MYCAKKFYMDVLNTNILTRVSNADNGIVSILEVRK